MASNSKYTVEFGHSDDPRIRTGISAWREFELSGPWSDIRLFLEDRRLVIQREMQVVSELAQMFRLQQELTDNEFFLALPNFLAAQRVQQNEEDHENRQEGSL